MADQPPKKSGGFSLYADLLDPQKASGSVISSAPVKYNLKSGGDDGDTQKKKDASLKFQPIKRPQVPQKAKPKPGASSSSGHKFSSSTTTLPGSVTASTPEKQQSASTASQQPQSNFEDWLGDEDEYYFEDQRRKAERANRKKQKKKNKTQERVLDWDDVYDPTMPNKYSDYKGSEEQVREIRDWKARLYYRQVKDAKKARDVDVDGEGEPKRSQLGNWPRMGTSGYKIKGAARLADRPIVFAPPSFDEDSGSGRMDIDSEQDFYPPDTTSGNSHRRYNEPPSFAPASTPDDATGEDAYLRRARMNQPAQPAESLPPPPPPPPATQQLEPARPAVVANNAATGDIDAKQAQVAASIAAMKAKIAAQQAQKVDPVSSPSVPTPMTATGTAVVQPGTTTSVEESSGTIARGPIRYENVAPSPQHRSGSENTQTVEDIDNANLDSPAGDSKSNRPGQKGFAQRLMQSYGWEKGQGLGAKGEGITSALYAKAEKRKKRPDSEGGGWDSRPNMGKILGGKKARLDPSTSDSDGQGANEDNNIGGEFGDMSEVVRFSNMLTGLDVQQEIEDNNLMQEIGDDMQTNYGVVERVFVWRKEMGGGDEVFVKFTSPLSALRAVKGMNETEFSGNRIEAEFFDAKKFDAGEYA